MDIEVEVGGFLSQNESYDYDDDYEYKDEVEAEASRAVLIPLLYSVVLVLGLLGNVLVLVLLARNRKSWSVSNTFVLHLTVADVLLLVTLPLRAARAAHHGHWPFGAALCKITGAVFHINFYCGIFLLMLIGVDRYLAIVRAAPLFPRAKPSRAHLSCLAVWLASLLLTVPDWMYLTAVRDAETRRELCFHNYGGADARLTSRLFHLILGFLLPTAVLAASCARILLRLRHKVKAQTSVLVLLPLAGVFLLCWAPYNITLAADTLRSSPKEGSAAGSVKTALVATSVLGCVHACLRPLLYLGLCGNFRKRSLALLRCPAEEPKKWLWELGVGEEAAPCQTAEQEGLKPITIVAHQVQTPQC